MRRTRARRKAFAVITDLSTHGEPFVACEQLARRWNVELQTIRRWIRQGRLDASRFGRALRVLTVSALAFERQSRLQPCNSSDVPRETIPSASDVHERGAVAC